MYFFNCTAHHGRYLPHRWLLIYWFFSAWLLYPFHLVLDPAGDTKQTGRQLTTCFERSVTLQLCEMVKAQLLTHFPHCTVTITRTAGETRIQEQRAQIANQRHADLFLHISCFADNGLKPPLALYYYDLKTTTPYIQQPYVLIPAHKAYELVYKDTQRMVTLLHQQLCTQSLYMVAKPVGIPDARLKGLAVPSCILEFGVSPTIPWTKLVDLLNNALVHIIETVDLS